MADKIAVVLLKPWGFHLKGAALTVDFPIAELLIKSGRAEPVEPKPKKPRLQSWVKP